MFQIRILFAGMEIMWNLLEYGSQIQVCVYTCMELLYVFLVRNNILLYTLSDPWVTIILNLQVAKQLSTRKCIGLLDM